MEDEAFDGALDTSWRLRLSQFLPSLELLEGVAVEEILVALLDVESARLTSKKRETYVQRGISAGRRRRRPSEAELESAEFPVETRPNDEVADSELPSTPTSPFRDCRAVVKREDRCRQDEVRASLVGEASLEERRRLPELGGRAAPLRDLVSTEPAT